MSASAPAFVRYAVLALAAALVVTLVWRGVRWTVQPPRIRNAPTQSAGASPDEHSAEAAPWQRDFTYALASAQSDATAGNIAAAEISVDRAESFVTVARLQSLAAQPEFIVSATRTPSCKDSRRNAMLRHDQALKEGLDEVAQAGFRTGT
jgi:hypothetical protein